MNIVVTPVGLFMIRSKNLIPGSILVISRILMSVRPVKGIKVILKNLEKGMMIPKRNLPDLKPVIPKKPDNNYLTPDF